MKSFLVWYFSIALFLFIIKKDENNYNTSYKVNYIHCPLYILKGIAKDPFVFEETEWLRLSPQKSMTAYIDYALPSVSPKYKKKQKFKPP